MGGAAGHGGDEGRRGVRGFGGGPGRLIPKFFLLVLFNGVGGGVGRGRALLGFARM